MIVISSKTFAFPVPFAVTIDPDELNTSVDFWVTMLPIVTEQIQDMQQNTSLRTICCDALGNLGVHVFEKLPVSSLASRLNCDGV